MSWEDAQAVKVLLDVLGDDVDGPVGIEAVEFSRLFVEVHDWLGLFIEDLQPLGDGLLVII